MPSVICGSVKSKALYHTLGAEKGAAIITRSKPQSPQKQITYLFRLVADKKMTADGDGDVSGLKGLPHTIHVALLH